MCHDAPVATTAVIFDIGGVLEITPSTGWQENWASRLGLKAAELVGHMQPVWQEAEIGGIGLEDVERATSELLMLSNTDLRAFMDDLWAEYLGTLNVGLAAYFAGLRPRYRTGILSNSLVGAREKERRAYDFEAMCDVVVYSHEEGLKKPDPGFYRIVCDRLGVSIGDAVFLDDVETCVEGARTVGMTAVRFVDNDQAIADLEAVLRSGPGPA